MFFILIKEIENKKLEEMIIIWYYLVLKIFRCYSVRKKLIYKVGS